MHIGKNSLIRFAEPEQQAVAHKACNKTPLQLARTVYYKQRQLITSIIHS